MKSFAFKLLIMSGIFFAEFSYGMQGSSKIEEGIKFFLTKEIYQQHRTADPLSIEIKILNRQNIIDKTCSSEILYHFPIYASINKKTTIIAECQGKPSWKVYIPLQVKFLANVLSVKTSLPKLHIIDKQDLIAQKINVINLNNDYFADLDKVVGLALKNSVKRNTILTSNLLTKVEHGA